MGIEEKKKERTLGKIMFSSFPFFIPHPASLILRRPRRRGQILIPSLLAIPSLLLFVYLLFETTKLSREKIRQQFAVDSAAFIQMGDYTNLLNRTAYVNGAFPYRIFKELEECPGPDLSNPKRPVSLATLGGDKCAYDIYYESGAFPKDKSPSGGDMDDVRKWDIKFDPSHVGADRVKFEVNPSVKENTPVLLLVSKEWVKLTHLTLEQAWGFAWMYKYIYTVLGSVEESQWVVFKRLTGNFSFFRKSYEFNVSTEECKNDPSSCGNEGVGTQGGFGTNTLEEGPGGFLRHYALAMDIYGRGDCPGCDMYTRQMKKCVCRLQNPYNLIDASGGRPDGLFQLATVAGSKLTKFGQGLPVYQGWDAQENFFGVKFNDVAGCETTSRPCVHALIATQCPEFGSGNNCVWPYPTPKYQTRLYP